jgi:type IV pilus assembly protein PilW
MNNSGFSLIEVLISLAISAIIITAAYLLFTNNQRIYAMQDEMVSIQQTVRPAAEYMGRFIRLAGLDPAGTGNFGFQNATNATTITFTFRFDADRDGDFDTDEQKSFRAQGNQLQEFFEDTGTWEPIAENIEVLNFVYLDRNGAVTNILDEIRTVQMSVIGRSQNTIIRHTDSTTYTNLQGDVILPPQNDNTLRLIFTETIKCRNLGI